MKLFAEKSIGIVNLVAFTPKGGCPLKRIRLQRAVRDQNVPSSIHPQGWVPIETICASRQERRMRHTVAFTPKGGCPLKQPSLPGLFAGRQPVAFTPKGGCPLKPVVAQYGARVEAVV